MAAHDGAVLLCTVPCCFVAPVRARPKGGGGLEHGVLVCILLGGVFTKFFIWPSLYTPSSTPTSRPPATHQPWTQSCQTCPNLPSLSVTFGAPHCAQAQTGRALPPLPAAPSIPPPLPSSPSPPPRQQQPAPASSTCVFARGQPMVEEPCHPARKACACS